MEIRQAELREADKICIVLRRSITELCRLDHNGSEEILAGWLKNKTTENVETWMSHADEKMLVAVVGNAVAGVGAASRHGEIILNYVSPDFRGQGVSTAILAGLEDYLAHEGNTISRLTSTATARLFYLGAGYEETSPPLAWRGGSSVYPMRKLLNARAVAR